MKVLIIAMCDSVHTAGWIRQFVDSGVRFTLYPSTPHRRVHPQLRQALKADTRGHLKMRHLDRIFALPLGIADLIFRNRARAVLLRRLIVRGGFDMIHILESQHAGYLYEEALKSIKVRPPTALSIWGNDLFWFARSTKHREQIVRLLSFVDLMFTECCRDQNLARELGYRGSFAARIPASGGVGPAVDLARALNIAKTSARRGIVVKGYTGFRGRARIALNALVEKRHLLNGFEISVYSASWWMLLYVRYLELRYRLTITGYRKKSLSHASMLKLFQEARVSLAVSLSDGLPGSAREAMWTGAFPIESVGSCLGEWLHHGTSCFLVDPDRPETVAAAVEQAIIDDGLVDEASGINFGLAGQLTYESVKSVALGEYEQLYKSTLRTNEAN